MDTCITCQIRQQKCSSSSYRYASSCNECNHAGIQCLGFKRPEWLASRNAVNAAVKMIKNHLAARPIGIGTGEPTLTFDNLIPIYTPMAISRLSSTGGSQSFNFIDYLHNKGTDTSYPAPQPEEPIRATRRYRPLLFTVASSRMSVQEMFECLIRHGCTNLSSQIDSGGQPSSAIAGGGFGDIYRGRLRDGTTVAIKALRHHLLAQDTSRKALKRAMRELYVWSKTKHENVQQLLGVVVFQGHLGMVSPWMDNGNLEEYIRKYPGADRYGLCVQVAKGVAYLHSINMVHGDLKARNVLVDRDGMAKLSDFDHSILSNCTLSFTETTNVGGGTLRWMAPELLLSDDDEEAAAARTTQTDVYALGMTLLETVTGRVPYAEYKVDRAIIRALDRGQLPKCPEEFTFQNGQENWMWSLLKACWDNDPKARPSASSVYNRLRMERSPLAFYALRQSPSDEF